MNGNKRNEITVFIMISCFIIGMLLGRIIITNWRGEVHKEVEEVLSRVVMIDVPAIDKSVNGFLEDNRYFHKYLTAIDIATNDYGIYEIKNNTVVAYAHGKCTDMGNAQPGFYEIVGTRSHIDYHNVRYWRVVDLEEKSNKNKLIVSSSGYEIADAPITRVDGNGLGNVQIDSEIMLTVYDNSEPGIVLIVIDSGVKKDDN